MSLPSFSKRQRSGASSSRFEEAQRSQKPVRELALAAEAALEEEELIVGETMDGRVRPVSPFYSEGDTGGGDGWPPSKRYGNTSARGIRMSPSPRRQRSWAVSRAFVTMVPFLLRRQP